MCVGPGPRNNSRICVYIPLLGQTRFSCLPQWWALWSRSGIVFNLGCLRVCQVIVPHHDLAGMPWDPIPCIYVSWAFSLSCFPSWEYEQGERCVWSHVGLLFVEAVEHLLYLRRVRQLLSCWCVLLQLRVSEHDSCSRVCGQVREQHTSTLIVFSQLKIYHYFFRGSLSILNCTHRIYCIIIVVCCFLYYQSFCRVYSGVHWCVGLSFSQQPL